MGTHSTGLGDTINWTWTCLLDVILPSTATKIPPISTPELSLLRKSQSGMVGEVLVVGGYLAYLQHDKQNTCP